MEAALVLKENSQQPWKTVEERAVSDGGDSKEKIQAVATAREKEVADTKPHSRRLRDMGFGSRLDWR